MTATKTKPPTVDELRAKYAALQAERNKVAARLQGSLQREEDARYDVFTASLETRPGAVEGVKAIIRKRREDEAALHGLDGDIATLARLIREREEAEQSSDRAEKLAQLDELRGRIEAVWIEQAIPAWASIVEASDALQWLQMELAERAAALSVPPPFPVTPAPADVGALIRLLGHAQQPGSLGEVRLPALLAEHVQPVTPRTGSYSGNLDVLRTVRPDHLSEAGRNGVPGSFQNPAGAEGDRMTPGDHAMQAAADVLADAWAD